MKSDIIIIGAGPGGYETALEAAASGYSVTLFNGGRLGGTCLNEGCIPTKCLCRDTEIISLFKNGEKFGIDDFSFSVDFHKIQERKNEVVASLQSGIEGMLKAGGVNVVNSKASFSGSNTVVADGEEYTADNIIIATGSLTKSLPIPGHDFDFVLDSTILLNIDYIPESLVIIGGGVIGIEFATIFNNLGTEVTVIEFMKNILPQFDSDISKRLKQSLSKKGIKIITGAAAKEIRKNEENTVEVVINVKGKEEIVGGSHVLMAVGRKANIESLNLEKAGVEYDGKGIKVDDSLRTSNPHVYAIGDVTGKTMLAHVASYQGRHVLSVISGKKDRIRFDIIPSAVFTVPECGMVGLTEDQCKTQGRDFLVGQSFFRANGKALSMGENEGLCKLIFDKESEILIGAHIMGVEGADLAQQCSDMMNMNVTASDINNMIFGHPTVSEVIAEAARRIKR